MKKLTVILVLLLAVVTFSGYKILAAEEIINDFPVEQATTCPMNQEGTSLRDRTRGNMGQMMNGMSTRLRQRNIDRDPNKVCPCIDDAE